jgi:hypothetical protein
MFVSMTRLLLAASVFSAGSAFAQSVAFDRPGIAFSPTTLPAGTVSWEQGLPDWSRDREAGVEVSTYAANTLLRVGLSEQWELQLGGSPYNRAELRVAGLGRLRGSGAGDTSIAFKYALAGLSEPVSWAFLGKVSSPTGNSAFTSGRTQVAIGTAAGWALSERHTLGLYANVSRDADARVYTLSPSLSVALSDRVGTYVEAGFSKSTESPTESIAGLGLTFMAGDAVQLDMSADWGLNDASTDLIAGFGVSIYFD